MNNVTRINPETQAIENIPHMLRYWADKIESDAQDGMGLEFAVLVLQAPNEAPAFCLLGGDVNQSPHPFYVSGALDWCRGQMLSVLERED